MQAFRKYAQYYPLIYYNKDYRHESDYVFFWTNRPKTILDYGCGRGRHAEEWSELGVRVYGVERSDDMRNSAIIAPKVSYYKYLSQVHVKVDVVTAMFNVMGYVGTFEHINRFPLKKDGYFVFDVWDKNAVLKSRPRIVYNQYLNGSIKKIVIPQEYRSTDRFITLHMIN